MLKSDGCRKKFQLFLTVNQTVKKKIKFFCKKIWSVQKKVVSLQCKNKTNE